MNSNYTTTAQGISRIIPAVLESRKLAPAIDRYVLVETKRATWLFACLNLGAIGRMEPYTTADTVHQISTALRGRPVFISNHSGLRYAVLLTNPPRLPTGIEYPGWKSQALQLGVGIDGAVELPWKGLGHMLVAGMTGSGKSKFLHLLALQAIQEGHALALADPDGHTFSKLDGHPALIAQVGESMDGSALVIGKVLAEITRRSSVFKNSPGHPDDLDSYNRTAEQPLKRMLVIVDEFNGLVMASGGPRGSLAQSVTQIAWRGRKFGINLILAGQDFTKEIVGPVRDQMISRVCFRVANPSISRIVIGRSGAETLNNPGRAWSTWGIFQAYLASFDDLDFERGDGLSDEERTLVEKLLSEHDGSLTYGALEAAGVARRKAVRLRQDWIRRGLARIGENNALVLDLQRLTQPA